MLSSPTLTPLALPVSRAPPWIGTQVAVVVDADGAAEEQIDFAGLADGEEAAVLEEERPLLGKQQVEPRQVDLLLVDFDLREVGVVGEIEVHARRHADLGVDAEVVPVVGVGGRQRSSGSPSRARRA